MGSQSFWISSYASPEQAGLIRCCFNPEKGFETEGVYTGFTNPSYVLEHPELPVLYSVEEKTEGAVGDFVRFSKQGIDVKTGNGLLRLIKVKPEGKGEMLARDWANGLKA